jgi:biotin operon repressor
VRLARVGLRIIHGMIPCKLVTAMETTTVEASIAAVREQVQSIVKRHRRSGSPSERVQVKWVAKPTPCWRITARIAGSYRRALNLWFTPHQVDLGENRIVLPESDILMFIRAGLQDDKLTLCLVEVKQTARRAAQDIDEATDLLHEAAKALEQLIEPTRQIAATRALRAVSKAIVNSPIQAVAEAASAPTDVEVLVRALQQPDSIETLKSDDPLAPARLRGIREREKLLEVEGGTLSADDVAKHLNITRQAVNKRRQQGALVGLDAGRHGYLYPAWQFVREGTIPDLEAVLKALHDHDPWMQHIFMVSGNTRLEDRTPLEALRQGRLDDLLVAARALGEHGAA